MSITQPSPRSDQALFVLRAVAALIFISAGTSKLFDLAAVLEIAGGLAVLVGLTTRPVAFILSGEMAVAYFQAHAPASPFPTVNGGVPAVLYCFLFLYLAFAGGGAFTIDRALRARRAARTALAQ